MLKTGAGHELPFGVSRLVDLRARKTVGDSDLRGMGLFSLPFVGRTP